ncbi:hypothetical protein BBW65_06715 [Helicobacter enhydrae]|uniref:Uncharacterized protein n=1 Tax=Helicobacter enhydrae TaxID=222136 RepID=A0A1B1U726_9HELI|nr:hypothetical protein BBW65_06715 [Helicobacter enhydrae]
MVSFFGIEPLYQCFFWDLENDGKMGQKECFLTMDAESCKIALEQWISSLLRAKTALKQLVKTTGL